jgi:hypothetical protein
MKKQIVAIHGGRSFDTHEEYIFYLKHHEVNLDKFKFKKDWKDSLEKELGDGFEVLLPRMPNGFNARYEEWKIWFERMSPFLNDGVVLIGHSLGGIFLAKYLAENELTQKIRAVLLVGAPFDDAGGEESLKNFKLPQSLEKFDKQRGKIYLFHSEDDPVVPFGELGKYQKSLSNAEIKVFKDRQHFNQESFPEIIDVIKGL